MGKLIFLLISLAVLFGFVYLYLGGERHVQRSEAAADVHVAPTPSAPKKVLDQYRTKAKDIEADTQRRADETFKKGD